MRNVLKNMPGFIKHVPIFILLLISVWALPNLISIAISETDSLNLKATKFLILKIGHKRGDLVAFEKPEVIRNGLLIKKVVGIAGDKIIQTASGEIWIQIPDQSIKVGKTQNARNAITQKTIPEGFIFVAGDNEQSFDSRYKDFGLVSAEARRAIPLF